MKEAERDNLNQEVSFYQDETRILQIKPTFYQIFP